MNGWMSEAMLVLLWINLRATWIAAAVPTSALMPNHPHTWLLHVQTVGNEAKGQFYPQTGKCEQWQSGTSPKVNHLVLVPHINDTFNISEHCSVSVWSREESSRNNLQTKHTKQRLLQGCSSQGLPAISKKHAVSMHTHVPPPKRGDDASPWRFSVT